MKTHLARLSTASATAFPPFSFCKLYHRSNGTKTLFLCSAAALNKEVTQN